MGAGAPIGKFGWYYVNILYPENWEIGEASGPGCGGAVKPEAGRVRPGAGSRGRARDQTTSIAMGFCEWVAGADAEPLILGVAVATEGASSVKIDRFNVLV